MPFLFNKFQLLSGLDFVVEMQSGSSLVKGLERDQEKRVVVPICLLQNYRLMVTRSSILSTRMVIVIFLRSLILMLLLDR